MTGRRRIRCRDLNGRRQQLIVDTHHDRVLLVTPPAATAVLTCFQVGQLRAALRDATTHAMKDPG